MSVIFIQPQQSFSPGVGFTIPAIVGGATPAMSREIRGLNDPNSGNCIFAFSGGQPG
jgi:hypothetical protein